MIWTISLCRPPYHPEDPGLPWPVVVEEDAGSTGNEHHDQCYDYVSVGHQGVQAREVLAVQVEQQRHHAKGQ